MKMRTVVGGAVVVAFVAGGYLGGWFPKFGTGSGFGVGTGGSGSGDNDSRPGPRVTTASQKKLKGAATESVDPDVLHVRIDERNYAIVIPEGDKPVSLEELLEQVQYFAGNRQGTRVRVSRTPSSRTTAEIQLRDALVKAGLSEDEIDWQDGPRP
jgi:hypothetical protein